MTLGCSEAGATGDRDLGTVLEDEAGEEAGVWGFSLNMKKEH